MAGDCNQKYTKLAVLLLGSFIILSSVSAAAVTNHFWISPEGNDAAAGTAKHPFRTLLRARDAVREISLKQHQDVVVTLRGGIYSSQPTLTLSPEDSGRNGHDVVYRAAPGEQPILSGGIQVKGWVLHDQHLGIYRAHVGPVSSRQLYVNGQRATRAQTTPYPAGFRPGFFWLGVGMSDPIGIQFIPTPWLNPLSWYDPATWNQAPTDPRKIEAVIQTQWKMMRVPVDTITPYPEYTNDFQPDQSTGLIKMREPAWTNANVFVGQDGQPGVWSFWQVSRFENAYQFLDEPGEWYLDETRGDLYYIPREDLATADVVLPVQEWLINGQGSLEAPIEHIRFEGLTFAYATWLGPSSDDGYVADQSGFHLTGYGHPTNVIGHDPNDTRTPGNVAFRYARNIVFQGNTFEHLGAVGLDFGTGSQKNHITGNRFIDISSAAIQLGGVETVDHHPQYPQQETRHNRITNNLIRQAGREYTDAAGIYVGFTNHTRISQNSISDVPWSGIAIGWGWGLLDDPSFPGAPGAVPGQWGIWDTPSTNHDNRIVRNRIDNFLNVSWDGGAIYTNGFQGTSYAHGLLIEGNVASHKRPDGGGNTWYTDAASRYITLRKNVSLDNPRGEMNFGPAPAVLDPLPYSLLPSMANGTPYGGDFGGCVTYGDIRYQGNYAWYLTPFFFYDFCPAYTDSAGVHPINQSLRGNRTIKSTGEVSLRLLRNAGPSVNP